MNEHVNATPDMTEEEATRTPFETFLYHQRRALEEASKAVEALLPEGFRDHGQKAGEEFRKGMKVLFEVVVNEVEKASTRAREAAAEAKEAVEERPSTTGKSKIKVQVE